MNSIPRFSLRSGLRGLLATGLLAVSVLAFLAPAGCQAQSEEGIKAAFLYNFAKFTEWPGAAFASDSAPITVGFVGATALVETFEKNITGKNANGREFVVKKLAGPAEAAGCHIVFVADAAQVAAVLGAVKGKAVLTVSDVEGFTGQGGMVGFGKDGAKVAFDLALGPAQAATLKVDPKLQKIAKSVKGG